jgi:glutamine cyclotransferase
MEVQSMRKTVLLWMAIIPAVSFFSVIHAAESKTRAVLENSVYEFSAVVEGVDVEHDFILKNTGSAALEIVKLSAG